MYIKIGHVLNLFVLQTCMFELWYVCLKYDLFLQLDTIVLNTVAYLLFSVYPAFAATLLFIDFFSQWCLLLVFMSDFNNSMQKSLNTAF